MRGIIKIETFYVILMSRAEFTLSGKRVVIVGFLVGTNLAAIFSVLGVFRRPINLPNH